MNSLPRVVVVVASILLAPLLSAQDSGIVLDGVSASIAGSRDFALLPITPETSCNAGPITCGGSASGRIGQDSCGGVTPPYFPPPYVCYSFAGQKGQLISVSASSDDFRMVAGITDRAGIIAQSTASAVGLSAVVTATLPRTDSYSICVTAKPGGPVVFGNYTVSVFCGSDGACIPTTTKACLLERRFSATMRYRAGFDEGVPDTDARVKLVTGFGNPSYETVFFYFNSAENIELTLKMLDQGNTNSQGQPTIAVLFGTATPLGVELTIVDTQTGTTRSYGSEFGKMKGQTDFAAFVK